MAAPRGPAHRPPELFDGPVVCRRPPLDGRRRARPWMASHYCRPARPAGPAPSAQNTLLTGPRRAARQAARLRSGVGPGDAAKDRLGRRTTPPTMHRARGLSLPEWGQVYSGYFPGNRHGPRRADLFPTWLSPGGLKRSIWLERCRLDLSLKRPKILLRVGRRALLRCASALSICPWKELQVPQCLVPNSAAAAWRAA